MQVATGYGNVNKEARLMYHIDYKKLKLAAEDFRYLLNKNYPRKNSLNLVGDRYNLDSTHREILHRAIYSKEEAKQRKLKQLSIKDLKGAIIGIDGHNIFITLESALKGIPLVDTDDGVIRDIAGVSSNYKVSKYTYKAINLLTEFLKNKQTKRIDFYFDSPVSHSGELASVVANNFSKLNLPCRTSAVKVPEKKLIHYNIIATSDSDLIDRAKNVIDIAGLIIKRQNFSTIKLN